MTDDSQRPDAPAMVLGAGYAGLSLAHEIIRASRGKIPVTIVDRHPFHVLRTELFEVGRLATNPKNVTRWVVPLSKALDNKSVAVETAEVEKIDLARRVVFAGGKELSYRALAICLGSVPSYYGVPGAERFTHQVYRMGGAQRLAAELRRIEQESASWAVDRSPEIAVVGGGSTGTEVAAEIATADWPAIVGARARQPRVRLVTGAVPFLEGLPDGLVSHARRLLKSAGVEMIERVNVNRVDAEELALDGGARVGFDVCVWSAGVQVPGLVRELPTVHGRAGRIAVNEYLQLREWPGVFAVGDVVEFKDPKTGMIVPATAQAALAEAPTAGRNVVEWWSNQPLRPFKFREKGFIVSVGTGQAAGQVAGVTVWGSPAALIATLQRKEYALRTRHGR